MKKIILEIIRKLSFFSIFIIVTLTILGLSYITSSLPLPWVARGMAGILLAVVAVIGLILILYAAIRDLRDFLKNKELSKKKWSLPSICSFLFMMAYLIILIIIPKPTTFIPVERLTAFSSFRFMAFFLMSIAGFLLAIYGIRDASRNDKKGELIASIAAVFFGIFTAFGLFVSIISLLPTEEIFNLFERIE